MSTQESEIRQSKGVCVSVCMCFLCLCFCVLCLVLCTSCLAVREHTFDVFFALSEEFRGVSPVVLWARTPGFANFFKTLPQINSTTLPVRYRDGE